MTPDLDTQGLATIRNEGIGAWLPSRGVIETTAPFAHLQAVKKVDRCMSKKWFLAAPLTGTSPARQLAALL